MGLLGGGRDGGGRVGGTGRGRLWKVLGVAGLAGVAATGVVVARDHRRRTQMSPDEVRDRLRERLAVAEDAES